MKPRSGRTIPLYFKVSPQEKEIIDKKMAQLGIHNQRAYLRKMAVDGYAVQVDMSDFKALVSLLVINIIVGFPGVHFGKVNAENEKTADALKSVEKRLANMAVLMKHVTTYQKTKPVYEAYRRAKDKDAYRAKQESSLILHEAAAKALKTAGVSKLPNVAALQVDYEKLREQKEALYADYGKLKKQVKEYDVIKQNIDSILRQPREPEREKGKERGE